MDPLREDATLVQRDREKTKRPDAKKSADAKAARRKHRVTFDRALRKFLRTPKGKQFYRKLARFNARNGKGTEDPGRDFENMMNALSQGDDFDPREYTKILRRASYG